MVTVAGSVPIFSAAQEAYFMEYASVHNKSYGTFEEYTLRQTMFHEEDERIKAHNARFDTGEFMFTMGHNYMTDWTPEEKKAILNQKTEMPESVH